VAPVPIDARFPTGDLRAARPQFACAGALRDRSCVLQKPASRWMTSTIAVAVPSGAQGPTMARPPVATANARWPAHRGTICAVWPAYPMMIRTTAAPAAKSAQLRGEPRPAARESALGNAPPATMRAGSKLLGGASATTILPIAVAATCSAMTRSSATPGGVPIVQSADGFPAAAPAPARKASGSAISACWC